MEPASAPAREATRSPGDLDSGHLAAIMKALANPVRIELLKTLRSARTLGEIRLTPTRKGSGREGRPINRVTARQHLDLLLELGVVRRVRKVRDGRALDHYLVHHTQLFALLEELRQMVALRPEEEVLDGTLPGPLPSPLALPGPKLALVQGAAAGRVFPLEGVAGPGGRWIVGRRSGSAACIDYDPYVSLENAEVARRPAGFEVRDLGSRNGTWLNWERLPADAWRPLARGDLLGVGRSVLVFRDA